MDELIGRLARGAVFGCVTFVSTYLVTSSLKISIALALVPIVLNGIAVMSEVGHTITGLSFLAAVAVLIFGHEWVEASRRIIDRAAVRFEETAPSKPLPKAPATPASDSKSPA